MHTNMIPTPSFADFEISFLRLLENFTNGTTIEISVTGMSEMVLSFALQLM